MVNSTYRGTVCPQQHQTLPYCQHGNHSGRWLQIPKSVRDTCHIETYMAEWNNELNRLRGKRMMYDGFVAIRKRFVEHCQKISSKTMWESITHHPHLTEDAYLTELKRSSCLCVLILPPLTYCFCCGRYVDGSICTLASMARTDLTAEASLSLFAPYGCKYRLYTRDEV